jgi:hypothetical protein
MVGVIDDAKSPTKKISQMNLGVFFCKAQHFDCELLINTRSLLLVTTTGAHCHKLSS